MSHESDAYPSAHARGMWDNVVSWMKMAVDFISKDSTAEPVPEGQSSSSRSKVRMSREGNRWGLAKKKKKKRLSSTRF